METNRKEVEAAEKKQRERKERMRKAKQQRLQREKEETAKKAALAMKQKQEDNSNAAAAAANDDDGDGEDDDAEAAELVGLEGRRAEDERRVVGEGLVLLLVHRVALGRRRWGGGSVLADTQVIRRARSDVCAVGVEFEPPALKVAPRRVDGSPS